MDDADQPYLRVRDLTVRFATPDGGFDAVDRVSFTARRGRILGVVGESGSGKSVLGLALLGLHDPRRTTVSGRIVLGGRDLVGRPEAYLRRLRGREVAMVFQDPLAALHPHHPVGRQIAEALRAHQPGVGRRVARRRAVELLDRVGVAQPVRRAGQYPHQLSGGLRQRALIAMALVNEPVLLVADEPTSALDATAQAQVLDLLAELRTTHRPAVVLISHDLGVIGQLADDLLVLYAGRVVEYGTAEQVLRRPRHPYTWGLLASAPTLAGSPDEDLVPIPGSPPDPRSRPPGCAFHPRCRYAAQVGEPAVREVPELLPATGPGHLVACHLPEPERQRLHAGLAVRPEPAGSAGRLAPSGLAGRPEPSGSIERPEPGR
nr:ABC transporter ATP-binding protein [Micromonospora sp. DSM 115978]